MKEICQNRRYFVKMREYAGVPFIFAGGRQSRGRGLLLPEKGGKKRDKSPGHDDLSREWTGIQL